MEKQALNQKNSVIIYALGFVIMLVASVIIATLFKEKENNAYIYVSYLVPQAAYLIAIFSYTHYANVDFSLNLKENVSKNKLKYLYAVILGVGLFFTALLLNYFLTKLYVLLDFDMVVTVPELNSWIDYLLSFLLICILPPICEELMFRKTLSDGFTGLGTVLAALLSALIFSLSHLNPVQTVYQFLLGFILALIYLKTKDILITIITHAVNNILAFFLSALTNPLLWEQLNVLILCFLIGLPVAFASFCLILKGSKVNTKRQEKPQLFTIILIAIMLALWLLTAFI